MIFSEDSRVKIPCILHLVRLGYRYLSLKEASGDEETNLFPDLFRAAVARINPELEAGDISRLLVDVKLLLDNEDLGKAFYERLTERSGVRLIDFENFDNNSFHVVTELTCKNGDDEFRPDITLLINGMPLSFIEVKKPNNREGVLAERSRINTRSRNPRFRRFINATQLMVFSNNMEYADGSSSFRQFAISNMTGTSGRKRIDASTLETFSLALPTKELLLTYENTVSSFFERMTNNAKEHQQLAQLRDWLLPMLMNGQVTVA